jgi:beta-glucosidase
MTEVDYTYTDSGAPVSARVEDLLDRMTVEEKAGQLTGMWVGKFSTTDGSTNMDGLVEQTLNDVKDAIRTSAIGSVTPFGTGISPYNNPAVTSRIANQLQRVAINDTRLGIPLIVPVDAIHGHANVDGSAIFPHNLGMAATWNPELVRRSARITAKEMRATGATQNYSPTADVARDPRWGRTYETYGESPHLVQELVAAEIQGLQRRDASISDGVAATTKHFPAYSGPVRGEDAAPTEVSPTTLRRVYLPPFERAIDEGTLGIMPSYNSVDREPVHGSRRFLTDLLREELAFRGAVYSDWLAAEMLPNNHRTVDSMSEAVRQVLDAGMDMFSVGGPDTTGRIVDLVASGRYPEGRLDDHVRRVLRTKFRLGLFDDPFVHPSDASDIVGRLEHRQAALDSVRQSVTLLENRDETLPLEPDLDSVLVTGPNADSINNLCGGWSVVQNESYRGSTIRDGVDLVTEDNTSITHEPGASITETKDLDRVRSAAEESEAAVVVLGENWYIHEFGPRSVTGPTDEFPKRDQLSLPEAQRELLKTVHETGTPTVLVVVSGRPLVLTDVVEHADAVLMGYLPGKEGGQGIAEVVFGSVNPSGKLPISMPRSIGQLPQTHDRLPHPTPIGENEHAPSYDPLYEFGYGLSYADCSYEKIKIEQSEVGAQGTVDVTVTLENRGDRSVTEVVQLYVRDRVSSRVTPVRELKGFDRVAVPAGETESATLSLAVDALGVVQPDGDVAVEPGTFEVTSGGLSAEFEVV